MTAKCAGLGGAIFGHQFVKSTPFIYKESHYCLRCGMPRGGWVGSYVDSRAVAQIQGDEHVEEES